MDHSRIFEKAKRYYEEGLWTKAHLRALTKAGKLTLVEYAEITGEEY